MKLTSMTSSLRFISILSILVGILVGLFLIFPNGCTQPGEAHRVLAAQGYTQIQITGYKPFMGGQDDVFSTGFVAVSPSGQTVTGAVTSGAFKGYVIRFD